MTDHEKVKQRLELLVSQTRSRTGDILADNCIEHRALVCIRELEARIATFRDQAQTVAQELQKSQQTAERLAALCAGLNDKLNEINELQGTGLGVTGWHQNDAIEPLDTWFENHDWSPITGEPDYERAIADIRVNAVAAFATAFADAIKPENGGPGYGQLTEENLTAYAWAVIDKINGDTEQEPTA